jgi:hypothetical protein
MEKKYQKYLPGAFKTTLILYILFTIIQKVSPINFVTSKQSELNSLFILQSSIIHTLKTIDNDNI